MRRVAIVSCLFCLSLGATAAEQGHTASTQKESAVTQAIYNYRKVDEQLVTAGQPREEQLRAASAEGFKHVINLAPTSSRNALPDEAGLVRSLGMGYHYIPVDWEKPTAADFDAFERAMSAVGDDKAIVHCAANFRASAFYSLYAMKHLGWSAERAQEFRASIWKGSDYPVWDAFIEETQAKIAAGAQ
jgi:protein tyrosine phosphatase (PTP) superfamily phosphohydrolase (DUF442 family)